MDPHSFIARAEAQRWLGIAEKLLMGHDLVGSKTFAIRARESDPRLEAADQILAINDTLLAAEKRVVGTNGTQQPDFYAILQLVRFAQDTEHIASQYRRLAVMLNPHQNRFPYSDQAFQLVNDAWAVLSNPMRKSLYDSELDFPPQQQINPIGFNLEQQQHHQEQQHQHQQQQQQQQQQHNFFSLNHIGSGHDQELPESQQTFQTRVQQSHQHQQLQQHNFLSQNPVRPVPVREQEQLFQQREQEQLFQPQVQPFQVTSPPQQQTRPPPQPPQPQPPMQPPTPPPPAASPQPPLSWPQASPLSPPLQQPQPQHVQPQPQQQLQQKELQQQLQEEQQHHHHQQQESPEQNAAPVQLPSQVNTNNGVREEEEEETEVETEEAAEDVDDDSPTFWTACPYCFYMYEYPRVYAECTLRCDNCKRAFQAVRIRSPPPMIEGQEASFYCWGFFPLGVSMSHLPKNNSTGSNSSWTPFSSLYDVTRNVQDHLNGRAAPKKNFVVNKNSGPRVYIDDVADDIFVGISDPSDSSDVEWNSSKKKKVKRMKIDLKPAYKKRAQVIAVRVRDGRSGSNKNLQNGIADEEGVGVPTVSVAESMKKAVGSNQRRQSGRVAKELGKLDLNVEFNNNEGEEPAPRMIVGNRGNGQGEEDNIEGIGFFEGLDEFLSSLPILSVVNDEKVDAVYCLLSSGATGGCVSLFALTNFHAGSRKIIFLPPNQRNASLFCSVSLITMISY